MLASLTCLSSATLLCRHSLTITLGWIYTALCSTSRVSVAHFLLILVNIIVHLPLAYLQPLRVEVAALQQAEVLLDGRADVAVRAGVDGLDAELLDRRPRLQRLVVGGVVEEDDRVVSPVRLLGVELLRERREEGDHHARVGVGGAQGDVRGAAVVDGR